MLLNDDYVFTWKIYAYCVSCCLDAFLQDSGIEEWGVYPLSNEEHNRVNKVTENKSNQLTFIPSSVVTNEVTDWPTNYFLSAV